MEDLERRLRELELRSVVPSEITAVSNPFAPVSSLARRISRFQPPQPTPQPERESQPRVISQTSKLPILPLPTFDGTDLENFLKNWERWLRISGVELCDEKAKLDWLVESCSPKVRKLVEKVVEEIPDNLVHVLQKLEALFPKLENDLTLRISLDKISQLPSSPEPSQVAQLLVEMEETLARLSTGAMSEQDKFLLLVKKLHPKFFQELRSDRYFKHRTQDFESLKRAILEKSQEDWVERNLVSQKKQLLQPMGEVTNRTSTPAGHVPPIAPKPETKSGGKSFGKGKGQFKPKHQEILLHNPDPNLSLSLQDFLCP